MMKNTIKFIAACAILAGASGTFASENHAAGHANTHAPSDTPIGKVGVASQVTRTVAVDMVDAMRFTPAAIQAKKGETIRFVVRNSGQLPHEFVLGTPQDLKAHNEAMQANPEMAHMADNMLTVKPGETGEMVWQFTHAGTVTFACLQPGHYDAGMKGRITVSANPKIKAKKE